MIILKHKRTPWKLEKFHIVKLNPNFYLIITNDYFEAQEDSLKTGKNPHSETQSKFLSKNIYIFDDGGHTLTYKRSET